MLSYLREIIKQTIESLREHVAMELCAFRKEIESLTGRVAVLESVGAASFEPVCHADQLNNSNTTTESAKLKELESIVQSLSSKHEKI